VLLCIIGLVACDDEDTTLATDDHVFYTGMDLSYQPMLRDKGVQYYDPFGAAIELLPYLKKRGVELVRVRLWHSPKDAYNSLESVAAYCREIKAADMKILLDFHYSDTWADPGNQEIPTAWASLSADEMADSVYQYTKMVLNTLAQQQTLPEFVQIGNETNAGFLWNVGKVGTGFEDNWETYGNLLNHALAAVEEQEEASDQEIQSILHIAGVLNTNYFYQKMAELNIKYDIIGLSHYHYFHTKELAALERQLIFLAGTFQKPIMLVETNYPWTLEWNDWTQNWVGGTDQLVTGFSATPNGQRAYLERISQLLKALPNNRGLGFCWWAPDLVAFDGNESTAGSFMENLTTFDFEHRALPVLEVFDKY